MAEFDHGIKLISSTTGQQLARLAGLECRRWEAVESTLQVTTERLADRVFRARQGRERFVVYFEFYTTWEESALWNVLAKSGLLSERERLPTVCVPVVLRRQGYRRQEAGFRLTVGGEPTQQIWFREVLLWREAPQPWWEEVPGLMALYPLCRHRQSGRDAVSHAASVLERTQADAVERADWLHLLSVFGGLAYPRLDVAKIIGSEKMKDSKMWRDAVAQGELQRSRADVLEVLQARFESIPEEDTDAVNAIEDLTALRRLLRLAARCERLEEFQHALTGSRRRR
jgi:hypothetical protein